MQQMQSRIKLFPLTNAVLQALKDDNDDVKGFTETQHYDATVMSV